MTGLLAFLLALQPAPPAPFPFAKAEAEVSYAINVDELKAHVYRLASPEFLGRKGPGAARAAQHIAHLFQLAHLKPPFGKPYFQPVPNFSKEANIVSADAYLA